MRQRDKSDLPLPFLLYKYFLLRCSSSILSFYNPKPTFLVAASFENFKHSGKGFLQQSSKSPIFLFSQEEMAISFVVPEVNSTPLCLFSIFLLYSYSSVNLFTEYVFFSFFCSFDLQTL